MSAQLHGAAASARLGGRRGGDIIEFYADEFRAEVSPVPQFLRHVVEWFFAAKNLRVFENLTLCGENVSPEDMARHRRVCAVLIAFGEFAANQAKDKPFGDALSHVQLTVGCIEAETRMLHRNLRMFHDLPTNESEADAVLTSAGL